MLKPSPRQFSLAVALALASRKADAAEQEPLKLALRF
jgi:hypothetical protein